MKQNEFHKNVYNKENVDGKKLFTQTNTNRDNYFNVENKESYRSTSQQHFMTKIKSPSNKDLLENKR